MKPPSKIQYVSNGFIVTTSLYLSFDGSWEENLHVAKNIDEALEIVRKEYKPD